VTVAATGVLADKNVSPATHVPSPSPSVTAATSTPVSPSTTADSAPVLVDTTKVLLAGAKLVLPPGWQARTFYGGQNTTPPSDWCLTSPAVHVALAPDVIRCTLVFSAVVAADGSGLDADNVAGRGGDMSQCYQNANPRIEATTRTFGGRTSEWRHFAEAYKCPGSSGPSRPFPMEQYVVPTSPGYILFSPNAIPAVDAAMTYIAQHSVLPAQNRPLRLTDRGHLRTAHRQADGVHITIARYAEATDSTNESATVTYVIPTAMFDQSHGHIGDTVWLNTDGTKVTSFYDLP
jgi:hypothetical protein